jgi:hypothetical protein
MFSLLEHLNNENFKLFKKNTENIDVDLFTIPIDISRDNTKFFQMKFFNMLADLSILKNGRKI